MLFSFLAIAYKELLHVIRSRATFRLVLTIQAFQMTMAGTIDLSLKDLPISIVDEDRTSQSRELIARVNATRTLHVTEIVDNADEAREHLRAGRVGLIVVIPREFGAAVVRGKDASILVMIDGSNGTIANQALSALRGIANDLNVELQRTALGFGNEPPLTTKFVLLFNPQGLTAYFLLPGLLAVLMQQIINLSISSLNRERAAGTLERLLMTPLSPTGLLLGKMAPYALLGFIDMLLLLLAMRWIFGVPIRGTAILLVAAGVLFTITLLSLGMYLTADQKSSPGAAQQKLGLMFMSTIFLSGYLFPLSSLPKLLLPIAYALPATHMVAIMRGVAIRDTAFLDLLPHFVYLFVVPTLLLAAAVRRFNATVQP